MINIRLRERSSIQSAKTRPGADYGSDHEPLIAKFRLKLKKAGKTTRPFRYDLNQITYDYTVEVRNWLKGLDLIDRVPDELWIEVRDIVQETGIMTKLPTFAGSSKSKRVPKYIYFWMFLISLLIMPKPLTLRITTNWKILKEMGIPGHLMSLLGNLYAGQETRVRTGRGTTD